MAYGIPATSTGLPEEASGEDLPKGSREGLNDWKKLGYGGPGSPVGRHRDFFRVYMLDRVLSDLKHPKKAQLEQAMQGHVLGQAELVGTYMKAGR